MPAAAVVAVVAVVLVVIVIVLVCLQSRFRLMIDSRFNNK